MLCPVDDSELLVASFGGYQIHRCTQCLGVSVSGNLLRDVRAYAALEMHKKQGDVQSVRPCPTDAKVMKALEYKGVAMCVCPQCFGLWLGASQLSRLLELVGPPKQADLSKIGQSLTTMRSSVGPSSPDGLGDILEFAIDVFDAIGKLAD
jgi:Zn-finger nucleic acid-binding protein